MELKDFVAESIKQIIDGVNEAKRFASENGAVINPRQWIGNVANVDAKRDSVTYAAIETIGFDIAVTAVEGKSTKGGIGVFAGAVGLGTQGLSENQTSSMSRIRFSVPIVLPFTENS